jgi:hypothetical protein
MHNVHRRGAVITIALLVLISLATTSARAHTHRFGEQVWIATATTRGTLSRLDPAATQGLLGGPRSITLGEPIGAPTALAWSSERRFAAQLAAGEIPPSVQIVLYDPEGWVATPLAERLAPIPAMLAFGALARAHGLMPVITPHPSLMAVPGAVCGALGTESLDAAYLRCGIQAMAARAADIVEVQAQYLETDPGAYAAFVTAAAGQARQANPNVLVLSGISTTFTEDPNVLEAAWRSVHGVVDGHYLNVPQGLRPGVAIALARSVLSG